MRGPNGSTVTRIDDLLLVSFRKVLLLNRGGSGDRDISILGMLKVKILRKWIVDLLLL